MVAANKQTKQFGIDLLPAAAAAAAAAAAHVVR